MDYLKTYLTDIIFKHYFDFNGRATRKVFWLFTLNMFIINFVLGAVSDGILSMFVSLLVLLPSLGLSVRRLHDINASGWWILLGFIPVIGAIILIILACIPGTVGENKYGPEVISSPTQTTVV